MVRLLNRLLVVHLFLNGWSPSSSKKIQTRPLEALFMKKEKHVHIRYIKRWNIFAHVRKGYDSHCSGLTLTSRMYLKQLNRESFQSKYPVVNKIDRKLYVSEFICRSDYLGGFYQPHNKRDAIRVQVKETPATVSIHGCRRKWHTYPNPQSHG